MSNVSLYVVDLKRVQPFGMTTPRVTTVVNTGVNDLPKNVSTIKQGRRNSKISGEAAIENTTIFALFPQKIS